MQPLIEKAGSQRAAARQSGISQAQLSRILRRTGRYALSADVVRRLLEWVPQKDHKRLEVALLRAGEVEIATRYDNWLTGRTGEIGPYRRGKRFALFPDGPARDRAVRRHRLILDGKKHFRSLFAWFENQMDRSKARPSAARRALAYDRVLEPFLDEQANPGIELSWSDGRSMGSRGQAQSPGTERVRKVLEYGMKRELVLLDRPSEEARFKLAARSEFDRKVMLVALQEYLIQSAKELGQDASTPVSPE